MSNLFSKTLCAAGFTLAAAAVCLAPAAAAPAAATADKPAKAKVRAKASKSVKPAVEVEPASTEAEPDLTDTTTTDYDCELGNKVTIYHNENDDQNIALRWKKRLHRLTRIGTTTGARRFENPTFGLIWIGIPAKGMLLDSKLNRQLANECKSAEQLKPAVIGVIEPVVATRPGTPATAPAGTPVTTPAGTPAATPPGSPAGMPTQTPASPQTPPPLPPAVPPTK